MKIHYIIWNLKCTGGVRVYFEEINELIKRGHKVTISSVTGDPSWFPLKANVIKIKEIMDYRKLPGAAYDFLALSRTVPECDVLVAGWPFSVYPALLSGRGTQKFHSMLHYENMFFKGIAKEMINLTYKLPFHITVNSLWLQKMIKENHSRDSYLVNPAIDLRLFRPKRIKKAQKKRIVCLGKDDVRWKGVPEALQAMKIVMKKRKDVEIVFFGVKPLSIKTQVPYTFVKFPSDEELVNLYNSASMVLCPSWYESFPLPPLEAMACGTPVVTTRIGTEDYAFDGKNSLVVEPGKPKQIADAILEMLGDQSMQERFRKEGLRTASKFTWHNTVDVLEDTFKKSLDDSL